MIIINLLFSFICCTYVLISFFLSVAILFRNHDLKSFRFSYIIFSANAFIVVSVLFILNGDLLQLSEAILKFLYNLSISLLLFGALSFTQAIGTVTRTRGSRICATTCDLAFAILFTLSIADILVPANFIYIVNKTEGWTSTLHPFTKIMLFVAIIPLIFVLIDIFKIESPDKDTVAKTSTFKTSRLLLLGALVFFLTLMFAPQMMFFRVGVSFYLLPPILMTLFGLFGYLSYTRPLFWILSGIVTPDPLIREGYIGYFLSAFLDNGPQTLLFSEDFNKRMKLETPSLDILSLNLLTLAGTELTNKISLVPVPQKDNLSALTFSFFTKNPEAQDSRLQSNTAVLYAIVFPSVLRISLLHTSAILKTVLNNMQAKKNLQEIVEDEFLTKITTTILRLLL